MQKIIVSILVCTGVCETLVPMAQTQTKIAAASTHTKVESWAEPTPKNLLIAAGVACGAFVLYKIADYAIDAHKLRKDERNRKLMEAAEQELLRMSVRGTWETVRDILENNKNINMNVRDSQTGDTALIRAAIYGNKSTVDVLLKYNADCLLQNFKGYRAIDSAAHYTETVILLEKAATQALWKAIKDENTLGLHAAIAAKAELEEKNDAGKTAIMQAFDLNNEEIIKALIAYGAKLEVIPHVDSKQDMLNKIRLENDEAQQRSHNETATLEDAESDDDVSAPLTDSNS